VLVNTVVLSVILTTLCHNFTMACITQANFRRHSDPLSEQALIPESPVVQPTSKEKCLKSMLSSFLDIAEGRMNF
jgi:hypothetical protein